MVKEFDISVGKIIKALHNKGLLSNSIVVVLSGNGAPTEGKHANGGSNWPLRGLKSTLLEGGVRGSAVVYSPLFKYRGIISNELFHITDFLPTLYSAAGNFKSKKDPRSDSCRTLTIKLF